MRIGVIGVNGIGQAHLWALGRVEGVSLAAVCDVDPRRADQAAHDHNVPAFHDAAALCSSGAIDAVVVATPPGTHGELVRTALAAGMHVYCEKPFTPTCDEGYALADHAHAAERVLQVGFQFRYHKGYAALRDAVAQLGEIQRVSVVATNWFRAQQYFRASPWRATWSMAGGGVLMAQAVHQVDALIATVGLPVTVDARVRTAMHDCDVEDEATATLEWENGAHGSFAASLNEPAGREHFEIVGERGTATLTDGYDVRVAIHDPVRRTIVESAEEFPADAPTWQVVDIPRAKSEWFDMLVDAHRDFAGAVAEGRAPLVDGIEGTKSVELANAFYLSSLAAAPVRLPLEPGAYPPVYEKALKRHSLPGS
jgi:predicted dehydrogenase